MGDRPNDKRAPARPEFPAVFPEYEQAVSQLLWTVLNELMAASDPVLGEIPRHPTDEVPAAPSEGILGTSGTGPTGSYRPMQVGCEFVQPFDSILRVDTTHWAEMVEDAAQKAAGALMPQIFAHLAELCDATGQTVDARGKPFSVDLFLDVLERISISFDANGAPEMPMMVVHPKTMEQIRKLPPPTPEHMARHAEILRRKKQEFDARRRVRKLDQDT